MERMQLVAEIRQADGKGPARRLRRNGKIPAILYGEGEPKALTIDGREWMTGFRHATGNTIIRLKIDGQDQDALVKDIQDDVISERVMHIDFYAIHAGRKLHTQVPFSFEGSPIGVREGGILEYKMEELEVVCLPKDIPSSFHVDISHLGIGEALHVGEIPIPEGVEIRTEKGLTVVVVSHAKTEAVSTEDELAEGMEGVASDTEEAGGEA